jgi:hypothetical protein
MNADVESVQRKPPEMKTVASNRPATPQCGPRFQCRRICRTHRGGDGFASQWSRRHSTMIVSAGISAAGSYMSSPRPHRTRIRTRP